MARAPLFGIRLDTETRARWQAAADDAGYSLAEFIKAAVEAQIANVAVTTRRPVPIKEVVVPDKSSASALPGGKVFKGPDPKPSTKAKRGGRA